MSALLRLARENTGASRGPRRDELAFLGRYLEIEQARFGDRLTVTRKVEPEVLDALVPNLLLQPLVENAIRHGVERNARPGTVELRAWREGDRLRCEVSDNGPGAAAGEAIRLGVGLSNTRARLEHLYGGRQHFRLQNRPGGGLTVSLALPFRRAAGTGGASVPNHPAAAPGAAQNRRSVSGAQHEPNICHCLPPGSRACAHQGTTN